MRTLELKYIKNSAGIVLFVFFATSQKIHLPSNIVDGSI